ncbi:MAG: hypothetical protein NVS3B20_01460 [Polyangiales bacterium]
MVHGSRFPRCTLSSLVVFAATVTTLLSCPRRGAADPTCASPSSSRALAGAAAIVPGLAIHGAGHFVLGCTQTSKRLLAIEGIGMGAALGGGATFWLTGASRNVVGAATAVTLVGLGLITVSALADIYGVSAPDHGFGVPERRVPLLETELGYRHVYQRQFAYHNFQTTALDLRYRALHLHSSLWTALDDASARLRVLAAMQLLGKSTEQGETAQGSIDASRFELQSAFMRHAFDSEGFRTTTFELFAHGRLDLVHVGHTLEGSFAELGLGCALQHYSYAYSPSADVTHLLLMRAAYGIYFGRGNDMHGEVLAYYDHRHDDFAGGLVMRGIVSGVFGHFGAQAVAYFTPEVGLLAEVQAGAAYVTGLSLLVRAGRGDAPR